MAGGGKKDANASTWQGSPFHAGPLAEPRPLVLPPYQDLADAAAVLGHNFLTPDDDGPARRMPPFIVNDGKEMPSLGVAAALRAGGFRPDEVSAEGNVLRIGDRRIPLICRRCNWHGPGAMLINYRAPALVPTAS